jgi:bifunctional non-homologous end joining protein LigD
VFDLLYLDGQDLRTQPLIRRKAMLKKILKKVPNILYVDHIEERGKEFFKLISQQGLEGMVAKDSKSPSVCGKETWHWLKVKNPEFRRKETVELSSRKNLFRTSDPS